MKKRRVAVVMVAVGALMVGLTSCGDSSSEPQVYELTVSDSGVAGLPASGSAGIYEFTVDNGTDNDIDLDLIESGDASEADFLADLTSLIEGAPWPDYIGEISGLGAVPAHQSRATTMTLRAGRYSLVDTNGEVPVVLGAMEVTGDAPSTDDLPADATITAMDYSFKVDGIVSGKQTVAFHNEGPIQSHHGIMLAFGEGVDEQEGLDAAKTLLTLEEGQAPPDGIPFPDESVEIGSAVYSSGNGGTFEADFMAGTYVLLCFIGDRAGGAPHAIAYDMMTAFTVGS